MRTSKFSRIAALAAGLIVSFSSLASAQSYKADVNDTQVELLPSPNVSTGASKKFKPKDWLELESAIKLKVKGKPPESGYVEDVVVKWYVLIKNPHARSPKYLKITKTVQHTNLPIGEEVFASVYFSPATIRKVTGSDSGGKSLVEGTGIEVLIDGVRVGGASKASVKGVKGEWWKSNSLGATDSIELLDKSETPFAVLWWDRYLEVRPKRR